jgi:hypothetical protein
MFRELEVKERYLNLFAELASLNSTQLKVIW